MTIKDWDDEVQTGDKIPASEWNKMTDFIKDSEERVSELEVFGGDYFTMIDMTSDFSLDGSLGWVELPFDNIRIDELGVANLSNNSLDIQEDGAYLVQAKTNSDIGRDDYVVIRLMLNGNELLKDEERGAFRGGNAYVRVFLMTRLTSGDAITAEAITDDNETITLTGGVRQTCLGICRIV